jgi:hypothetical protein
MGGGELGGGRGVCEEDCGHVGGVSGVN